jgi:lipoprotein-anchoring transpeptidase ErfK/SrfK
MFCRQMTWRGLLFRAFSRRRPLDGANVLSVAPSDALASELPVRTHSLCLPASIGRVVATPAKVLVAKVLVARVLVAGVLVASISMWTVTVSTAQAQDRSKTNPKPSAVSSAAPPQSSGPQSKVERATTPFQFPVGSLVIVNNERRLYYITGAGEAVRYRVAVGKNQELWMGRTFVAAKVVDPKWIPVNGDDPVEGGDPANPLGKRAFYLDWSLLRIHGTPSRGSIGSATSNGCIRMLNEDVLDLFERVHFGAPVYAIRSWKEATLYPDVKIAEKIYHDPEAHREAQEDLQEQLKERAAEQRDKDASLRRERQKSKLATAPAPRVTSAYPGRLALGRGTN